MKKFKFLTIKNETSPIVFHQEGRWIVSVFDGTRTSYNEELVDFYITRPMGDDLPTFRRLTLKIDSNSSLIHLIQRIFTSTDYIHLNITNLTTEQSTEKMDITGVVRSNTLDGYLLEVTLDIYSLNEF